MSDLGGTFGGRVVVDPVRLANELRGRNGPIWNELLVAGEILKQGAQRRVGVETGTLRDSIVKRVLVGSGGMPELWVGTEEEHGEDHHEGTDPHTILPKKPGGVLSFELNGQTVFFKRVEHPGTEPNRFLTDSLVDLHARY